MAKIVSISRLAVLGYLGCLILGACVVELVIIARSRIRLRLRSRRA